MLTNRGGEASCNGGKITAMRALLAGAALCGLALGAVPTGPEVGQAVPDFRLQDQNNGSRTLKSILGPKGALLVFYRSADW